MSLIPDCLDTAVVLKLMMSSTTLKPIAKLDLCDPGKLLTLGRFGYAFRSCPTALALCQSASALGQERNEVFAGQIVNARARASSCWVASGGGVGYMWAIQSPFTPYPHTPYASPTRSLRTIPPYPRAVFKTKPRVYITEIFVSDTIRGVKGGGGKSGISGTIPVFGRNFTKSG